MNRRDFLKAGAAASVVGALPVNAKPINTPGVPKTWDSDRIERYQAYRSIMNDNFELDDKIQKIAGEAAKRLGDSPSDDTLVKVRAKRNRRNINGGKNSHRYLRNLCRAYNLAVYGDGFYELVFNIEHHTDCYCIPRRPILFQELAVSTVYRIETIKGKVIEYQQSKTGPDYAVLAQPLEGINNSTAVRFRPDQIYHLRIGPPTFQPYGTSLLEVVRKNPDARIGEGAIENFMTVFEKGMQDLKDLCK